MRLAMLMVLFIMVGCVQYKPANVNPVCYEMLPIADEYGNAKYILMECE